jgi:hypothetical protein
MSDDRRAFFKKAAGAAVGLASADTLLGATGNKPAAEGVASALPRGYGALKLALQLGDSPPSLLRSVEGGDATADVIERKSEECFRQKMLGDKRYAEIALACGTGLSRDFYEWIAGSFDNCLERPARSGAIINADYTYNEFSRLTFHEALITEFGMPATEGGSKESAYMTLKFAPASTERKKGDAKLTLCGGTKAQKQWLSANFRLNIDGLDCKKVTKVEAITVKWATGKGIRNEISNLVVSMAEGTVQDSGFRRWYEDFVVQGNNTVENEKGGFLEYLSPSLKEAYFTLKFRGLGIFKLAPDKVDAGSEALLRVTAEMYCNGLEFDFGAITGC